MNKRRIWGLNPNVFLLGIVSFLTDISSELIFTLLPLFLANVLGVVTIIIGLIEGVTEGIASLVRIGSGWLSDKLGKRKALVLSGYALSTVAKPFMYIATSWGLVFGIRFTDRLGKGLRTAPRDALLADSLHLSERGKGFGLHRAMDTSGAAVGLILAALVVFLLQRGSLELAYDTYQQLVLIGIVPATLALLMFLFIREPEKKGRLIELPSQSEKPKNGGFDSRFKAFLVIMFLFTLGNSSDAFLILRAQNLGNPVFHILLMVVLFNIVYATISLPAGILSDKLGRKKVIALGWTVYALVYLGFALASAKWQVWLLFGIYGLYYGLTEGVARAFVADLVPIEKRGTAYGWFHTVVGITLIPASLIAGWLWQIINPMAPFFFGAGMAFIAAIGLVFLVRG